MTYGYIEPYNKVVDPPSYIVKVAVPGGEPPAVETEKKPPSRKDLMAERDKDVRSLADSLQKHLQHTPMKRDLRDLLYDVQKLLDKLQLMPTQVLTGRIYALDMAHRTLRVSTMMETPNTEQLHYSAEDEEALLRFMSNKTVLDFTVRARVSTGHRHITSFIPSSVQF